MPDFRGAQDIRCGDQDHIRRGTRRAPPAQPFPQAWLGIAAALLGPCLIAVGPFPHVEWLHQTLTVGDVALNGPETANAWIKLPGFSQTLVRGGFEFWQGKAVAGLGL